MTELKDLLMIRQQSLLCALQLSVAWQQLFISKSKSSQFGSPRSHS